jgi:hypothetical protein
MPTPSITVLGVYKPDIPANVYREQRKSMGSDERTMDERTKAHFKDLVLIEALIDGIDDRFKMSEMGQPCALGDYPDRFQCAYDEALLSSDGETVVERDMNCVRGEGPLRFAFYLHYYDAARLLHWSYGQVQCSPIEPIPRRLKDLVPYDPCT